MVLDVSPIDTWPCFLWVYNEAADDRWNKAACLMALREAKRLGLPMFCLRTFPH